MRLQDLHTHSLLDDGKANLSQMVYAAMGKGLSAIGFSGHSPLDEDWTMDASSLPKYLEEAKQLKEKNREKIEIFCGIEYDLRSQMDLSPFDYVIGSLHATVCPAGAFDADNTPALAKAGIDKYFDGDCDAAAEGFFAQYQAMADHPQIDIVGHFDILTKFDEQAGLYHANSPRYLQAACAAMETLVRAGKIFEVNSGAMSRGYRTAPYPAKRLLLSLREMHGKILLSSDAHSPEGIGYALEKSLALVKECGFTECWFLTETGFSPVPIREITV